MTKVQLYDPHPGFAGAAIPLPSKMKELDGKTLTLEDAIKKMTPIADSLGGRVRAIEDHQFILFEIGGAPDHVKHVYRLIRYRTCEDG